MNLSQIGSLCTSMLPNIQVTGYRSFHSKVARSNCPDTYRPDSLPGPVNWSLSKVNLITSDFITVNYIQQEIRSVEHGICPIAEFTSPWLNCAHSILYCVDVVMYMYCLKILSEYWKVTRLILTWCPLPVLISYSRYFAFDCRGNGVLLISSTMVLPMVLPL